MEGAESKIENTKSFIDSINMEKVFNYLQNAEEWSHAEAIAGSIQYKNYLYLLLKYPSEKLPPSYTIQKVWEAHIISCLDEYILLKNQLVENSDHLNYEEYFEGKKFIDKSIRDTYEQVTKKLYRSEFQEELPSFSYLSLWGKYQFILLKWTKSLSFFLILAALTTLIIILIIQH